MTKADGIEVFLRYQKNGSALAGTNRLVMDRSRESGSIHERSLTKLTPGRLLSHAARKQIRPTIQLPRPALGSHIQKNSLLYMTSSMHVNSLNASVIQFQHIKYSKLQTGQHDAYENSVPQFDRKRLND